MRRHTGDCDGLLGFFCGVVAHPCERESTEHGYETANADDINREWGRVVPNDGGISCDVLHENLHVAWERLRRDTCV